MPRRQQCRCRRGQSRIPSPGAVGTSPVGGCLAPEEPGLLLLAGALLPEVLSGNAAAAPRKGRAGGLVSCCSGLRSLGWRVGTRPTCRPRTGPRGTQGSQVLPGRTGAWIGATSHGYWEGGLLRGAQSLGKEGESCWGPTVAFQLLHSAGKLPVMASSLFHHLCRVQPLGRRSRAPSVRARTALCPVGSDAFLSQPVSSGHMPVRA